jgi:hypothetical protein
MREKGHRTAFSRVLIFLRGRQWRQGSESSLCFPTALLPVLRLCNKHEPRECRHNVECRRLWRRRAPGAGSRRPRATAAQCARERRVAFLSPALACAQERKSGKQCWFKVTARRSLRERGRLQASPGVMEPLRWLWLLCQPTRPDWFAVSHAGSSKTFRQRENMIDTVVCAGRSHAVRRHEVPPIISHERDPGCNVRRSLHGLLSRSRLALVLRLVVPSSRHYDARESETKYIFESGQCRPARSRSRSHSLAPPMRSARQRSH